MFAACIRNWGVLETAAHEAIASTINDENVDAASRRVQAARNRFYIYFQSRIRIVISDN